MSDGRDLPIETLRGLTVLLVVAYHAIGPAGPGQGVHPYSPYLHFTFTVDAIIMPWFAAIAGYVYAIKPLAAGSAKVFLATKAQRLLLPMVAIITLMLVTRSVLPDASSRVPLRDIWRCYVFSFEYLWFLQALFWVFVVICVLETMKLTETPSKLAIILVTSLFLPAVIAAPQIFSLWGLVYLLPFFLLGCGTRRFPTAMFDMRVTALAVVSGLVALIIQQMAWVGRVNVDLSRGSATAIVLGLTTSLLLLRFRIPVSGLSLLGTYSYSIYLMHGFGLAMAKRLADHLPRPIDFQILLRLTCAIVLPIIAHLVLVRSTLARRTLLGMK